MLDPFQRLGLAKVNMNLLHYNRQIIQKLEAIFSQYK